MAEALPELVLAPGLDGTGDLFDRLSRRLASTARVTVIRYPQDPAMTYADYADFVCAAIGERSVALLGESFSGPVAVLTAARLTEQISGLILSATFLRSPWPPAIVRLAASLDARRAPAWLRDAVLMGRDRDTELSNTISAMVAQLPSDIRAARLREVAAIDVRPEFSRLECPVLGLHGDADWLVPKRPLEVAVRAKRGGEAAIIPGAHMLLQTQASEAALRISQFLQAIRSHHET